MALASVIRAQVESRLPGAFALYERTQPSTFATGIAALDRQIGGIPRGALTQIYAPENLSSGKTAMLVSLLAQMTQRGKFCALVDASDSFDPASAAAAGVTLSRVLWVRCGARPGLRPLEEAFRAADILGQSGGFGLIAVDLGNIKEESVRKVPLTTWFRFARVVEDLPAALVFLMTYPAARSCAGLTLRLECAEPVWAGSEEVQHAHFLAQMRCQAEVERLRFHGQPATRPRFGATPVWA